MRWQIYTRGSTLHIHQLRRKPICHYSAYSVIHSSWNSSFDQYTLHSIYSDWQRQPGSISGDRHLFNRMRRRRSQFYQSDAA